MESRYPPLKTQSKYPLINNEIDRIIEEHYSTTGIDHLNIGNTLEHELRYIQWQKGDYANTIGEISDMFFESAEPKNIKILDIGSLFGVMDITFASLGYNIWAYDIPEYQKNQRIRELYLKYGVHIGEGNLRDVWNTGLPYPSDYFDVIILNEVLEHLNFNPLPLFQEINRISKKSAILFMTTPNLLCLENRYNILLGNSINFPIDYFFAQLDPKKNEIIGNHWRVYTHNECIELLRRMGYSVIKEYYSTPWEFQPSRSLGSYLAHFLQFLNPRLRGGLVFIAKKESAVKFDFWFTDANV